MGICKYCGFSGTNDQMEDHEGNCPVLEKLHEKHMSFEEFLKSLIDEYGKEYNDR